MTTKIGAVEPRTPLAVSTPAPARAPAPGASSPTGWAPQPARSRAVDASGPTLRGGDVQRLILEDNAALLRSNPAGGQEKLQKLKASPFVFFRGAAPLFYRELKGLDAKQPQVMANGDVHPENFGVGEGKDGKLSFGLNDFDESAKAPFTFDLRRGGTAFVLAAREQKLGADDCEKVSKAFIEGYSDAIKKFVGQDKDKENRPLIDQSSAKKYSSLVAGSLDEAEAKKRSQFLEKRVDLKNEKFLRTTDLEPCSKRLPEFKEALERYGRDHGFSKDDIKDVALRLNCGTASLGAERYYVLIASKKGPEHDKILEVKAEGSSALEKAGVVVGSEDPAERVVKAHQVQVPDGDPYYGAVKLAGRSFLVRERSPHKEGLELATTRVSAKDLKDYATACGAALAQAHARSGKIDGQSAEKAIDQALDKKLKAELVDFASVAADRVTAQYRDYAGR